MPCIYPPFHGQWICDRDFFDLAPIHLTKETFRAENGYTHKEELKNRHMLVRKNLCIENKFGCASIRITADDYYKLYINGRFVGQGPAPGYTFAYYFNEYDITEFLKVGDNIICADVYYQGLVNRVWNSGDYRQGMIADITVDQRLVCCTDESFECTTDRSYTGNRVTGYSTQFLEDRDSRIRPKNWSKACVKAVDYRFEPQPAVPLQVYTREPLMRKPLPDGGWFYDFGGELTGSLRIKAAGSSGSVVRILCGEECDGEGRVRFDMRCGCVYEEFWTLEEGENLLEQYDYKAFRYVELHPVKQPVTILSMACIVRHYPFPKKACVLDTSDTVLQSVFSLCKETVKYGCQEVFVDCPSREKGQYIGDLTITGAAQLWLTGDGSLLRKAITNMAQSLRIADGLLAVVPGSFVQEIADYSLQFPLILWRYYTHTGDLAFLREMLPVCDQLIRYFKKFSRSDGLLQGVDEKWNMVDWPENLRDGYDFPLTEPIGLGCHNVINAFYIGCVKMTERIKTELSIPFSPTGEALTAAYNRCFYNADKGLYTDSETSAHASLHANCLPVFFGLFPKVGAESIAAFLVQRGLCCGVYMAYFYLKALARLGRCDAVYALSTSTGENSWHHMIQEGATTCFEVWGKGQKWNTSLCHPWAASPVPILIEDLAGICCHPKDKSITVSPHLPKSLERLRLTVPAFGKRFCFDYHGGRYELTALR